MRQTEKGFTRRGFLTGSALALGGVAISAMGCAPAQKEPESKPATDEPTGDPSYVDPWAGHYAADWADKVTETVDTDLVIVGAGVSGVVAALEAAQNGIKVELLEATKTAGGNGNFSDCVFTFGSPSADRRRRKGRRHGDGRPDHPE